jgi:2,4-dienoyl-CoA reductase-like NADH-dependent reductase (Old Yellow Enzyme family)
VVGLITSGAQAARIIRDDHADMVLFGRAMLADPQLPLRIAAQLDPAAAAALMPPQYERGLRSLTTTDDEHIPEL